MFPIYCCCCSKPTENLLSIRTKSSHEDGKTLLDYLNYLFGTFLGELQISDSICPRCSKALQVAYHFFNMVNKSKESKKIAQIDLSLPEIRHKIQDKQNNPLHEWQIENHLKFATSSETASQAALPVHMPNNFKIFLTGSHKAAGSSLVAKHHHIDFICNICNTSFDNKTSFVEHNRQKHKEIIPYKCKLCNFYTCYTESLFKHCEKNHGLNNVVLDLYQHKERTHITPQISVESPEFEVIYACISCNFEDSDQAVVDEHFMDQHSVDDDRELFNKKLFSCPACCRSFKSLKSAKIHFSMYHISSFKKRNVGIKRKFFCEKCGKRFDLKSGLLLHKLLCEKRKIVNCNFCNREFSSVLKYERHLQDTHSVAIKHECETCSKRFNCSEYLAVHRKRHNQRNFLCDLCPKTYINNAELKVHKQRIHAGRTFGVCKKKFTNLTPLRKHHENTMHNADFGQSIANSRTVPYRCHACQKEFASHVLLRQHLKQHHFISLPAEELFAEQNNSLEKVEMHEIEELGVGLKDIMHDSLQRA